MTTPEIKQNILHDKWVKERSLVGLNRIRSVTYFAFNVLRNRYPVNRFRNEKEILFSR